MKKKELQFVLSMAVFGSIGLVVKYSSLPAAVLVFLRGCIGAIFLFGIYYISGNRIDTKNIRKYLSGLILCGIMLSFNWIFLFEAYKHTSVAVATVTYYLAPIILMILSVKVLKERLKGFQLAAIIAALTGTILISEILSGQPVSGDELLGIFFGLLAAVCYALLTFFNKKTANIQPVESTIIQFLIAILLVLPYILLTQDLTVIEFKLVELPLILIMGILHTGIGFYLYFASIQKLPAQTIALFSYIDPLTAIILSALLLGERLTTLQTTGTLLIIGATIFVKLPRK